MWDFVFLLGGYAIRPCERRLLPKFSFSRVSVIGVFRKLGLERVIRAFSELVPTRGNSFRLVPTLIFAKNREKTRLFAIFIFASFGNRVYSWKNRRKVRFFAIFIFASFGNRRFTKIRVGTSFSSFFQTRLDSRKLVPTRNSTRKFGKKFGMQGPSYANSKWLGTAAL